MNGCWILSNAFSTSIEIIGFFFFWFFFTLISYVLEDWSKKILLWFMSKSILPMFFLGVLWFQVLCLDLYSILTLFLYLMQGNGLISLFYMWLSSFLSTICWRDGLFFIVYSCLLCCRLTDHICIGLFLGPLFCSIEPYICFCANTMLFWLL